MKMMAYRIENRLSRVISLPLNSGEILYLEPFATSELVADEELSDDTAVNQLLYWEAISLKKVKNHWDLPGNPTA